jgi:hypothetical protein
MRCGLTEHLPWALGDTDLGDDVLEVGPGYGATTDAAALAYHDGRFCGAASLTMLHHVPTVRTNPYGWAVIAHEA